MTSMNLIERVYESSKKFVKENFRDELMFFDNIWEIYESELRKYQDKLPEKRRLKISRFKLMGALGFSDSSQVVVSFKFI